MKEEMIEVSYQVEENLAPEEYRSILIKSTLGKRRPVDDSDKMANMVKNAGLIVTARINDRLVGLARAITDFTFCTYLSDLAVDEEFQKKGIGKRLIIEIKKRTPTATLTLLAAPEALHYYKKIGMTQFEHCYRLKHLEDLL